MATKEIGIKLVITSQGQDVVISNLEQLETQLRVLQEQIKTLDFGSPAFKEAAKNIQVLKSQIADIDKQTEGLDVSRRFQAISNTIGFLTSSFQALTGAIGLFITEADTLEQVQKAQAQALNVINLALGVNNALIQFNEGATARKKIADLASAAATKVATAATAAWNAVLALNPVVAIAAGIAALTAGIYLLVKAIGSETSAEKKANEVKDKELKINNELYETRVKASSALAENTRILTDNVKQRNLESQAIDELNKQFPGFNAFVDENNQLTDQGNKFLLLNIKLLELQAQQKALLEKRQSLEIDTQKKIGEEIQFQNTWYGKLWNTIKGGGTTFGGLIAQTKELVEVAGENNIELEAVNNLYKKNQDEIEKTLELLNPYNTQLEKQRKLEEQLKSAQKEKISIFTLQNKVLETAIEKQSAYLELLKQIQEVELGYTASVLEEQEKLIGQQEQILEKRNQTFKTKNEQLKEVLNELITASVPGAEELQAAQDVYGRLFDFVGTEIENGLDITGMGFDDLVNLYAEKFPLLYELIAPAIEKINEEGQASFIEYFQSIDDRVRGIQNSIAATGVKTTQTFKENITDLSFIEDSYYTLLENRIEAGNTLNDVERLTQNLIEQSFGISEAREQIDAKILENKEKIKTANEVDKKALEEQNVLLEKQKENLDGVVNTILEGVKTSSDFYKTIQDINKEANANVEKLTKNIEELKRALTPEEYEGLKVFFQDNASQIETLLQNVIDNYDAYFKKVGGTEGILGLLGSVEKGIGDINTLSRQELEELAKILTELGGQFQEKFGTADNPFLNLLDKISKKLKQLPTESEEAFQETIDNIKKITDGLVAAFQDISQRLSDIFAQQNSLLLEQLDYQEKQTLASIGDATEREKQEQEKVQKEYAQRRFEIEKKARIQELEFSLANTIAQAAQAVVNALATIPAPFGAIYAGVIGGLTAAQIATINNQIQFTKSKAYVARRGGAVSGLSHENGGVPMLLEGGEFIMNKEAVSRYGNQLQSINNATGGKPLSIDDSRLVQAIASQNIDKNAPLKAYVLYNDIEDTTKLNKRISQLSKL